MPLFPDRILVYETQTKTSLIVGQHGSCIYPLSVCCRARALPKEDRFFGTHWACGNCRVFLGKRYLAPSAINDFEKGVEGPVMVASAVSQWIGVDLDEIAVEISNPRGTASTGPR